MKQRRLTNLVSQPASLLKLCQQMPLRSLPKSLLQPPSKSLHHQALHRKDHQRRMGLSFLQMQTLAKSLRIQRKRLRRCTDNKNSSWHPIVFATMALMSSSILIGVIWQLKFSPAVHTYF